MIEQKRMSPLTAFFIGLFGVGGTGIVCITSLGLYGMNIVERKADGVLTLAGTAVADLPAIIEALPPSIKGLIGQRDPTYRKHIAVAVAFVDNPRGSGMVPSLTIKNNGDEAVTMMAVRVAALSPAGVPLRDWTQVVATPIAGDHDLPGVLMPHDTRHVVLRDWHGATSLDAEGIKAAYEISELRLWQPHDESKKDLNPPRV